MIVELAAKAETNPPHLSRDASSLAVPQEDSMCGDGPSVQEGATGKIYNKASGPRVGAPLATMKPEAAQDSDAPVARCPDAPIESTAPL